MNTNNNNNATTLKMSKLNLVRAVHYAPESYFEIPYGLNLEDKTIVKEWWVKWQTLHIVYQDGREEEIEHIHESEGDYKYPSKTEIVNAFEEGLEDFTSYQDRVDEFVDDDEEYEDDDSMKEDV